MRPWNTVRRVSEWLAAADVARPLDVEREGELTLLELAPSYKTFAKS